MSDIICVTNRLLCNDDFLTRINCIAKCSPRAIILREKDLSETEYEQLAKKVRDICTQYGVAFIPHSFYKTAKKLHSDALHMPLSALRTLSSYKRTEFSFLGASCHSAEDASEAEELGCSYITAGHIFDTDCKKGLPGRGEKFLEKICKSVSIPVYAIGGINPANARSVRNAGAAGICIMSGLMRCDSVEKYFEEFCKGGVK